MQRTRFGSTRTPEEIAGNLAALRIVARSWIADGLLLIVLSHLAGLTFFVPALYVFLGLTYVATTYWAMSRGMTERFADPTLTFPQLILALSNQTLCFGLAPEVGIFFLLSIFQTIAFGLFSLHVKQFRILLVIVTTQVLLAVLFAGSRISFPVDTLLGQLLLFASFAFALKRFVWIAGYMSSLRRRISAKNLELAESELRFRSLTEMSSDWYWEQDAEMRFTRLESGKDSKVLPQDLLLGKRLWESAFSVELDGGWDGLRKLCDGRQHFREVVIKRVSPDRREYFVSLSGGPILDKGIFKGYRGVAREVTDEKLAEERIQHLATHDGLTGLPNRLMFNQLLTMQIQSSQRAGRRFAVLFIDLDRFKLINDTLGHEAGDSLLKELSSRFRQALRTSDIIARLGGDEFVVLIPELGDEKQAAEVARKLLAAAVRPMVLAGQECRVSASVGIALYPNDGTDEQALLKNADSAMYLAKEEGKNNFQFYSTSIGAEAMDRLSVEMGLRHALERNEFEIHYQAKLDLRSGQVSGTEALLRWNNPSLGQVPPVHFIHVAEESGLIVPIGKWVLRTACEQNMAWQGQGMRPIRMAVNLSARQFSDRNLVDDIAVILAETGMPASLLELEITEGMVAHNPQQAVLTLQAIKQLGVRLAIDDFGTGYSSLGQLRNFPIHVLKIDRSFIRELESKAEDRAIVEAVVAMGKTLRMTVVAEGVETAGQQDFLLHAGCDEVQGFHISRPIAAEAFARFFETACNESGTATNPGVSVTAT
jgi:diguanylate cyclase (GGDEF)-like protein